MNWTPNPALYLSPEMVAELALGVDKPLDIAQKYGLSAAEFAQLNAQQWFGEAVFRKREELHANGVTFVTKASMMAEEVMQDLFQVSKTAEMRPEHRLEFLKQLADYSGLKPKAHAAQVASGPAFTINIQLPSNPQGPGQADIVKVGDNKPEPMVIDLKPLDPLPPMPAGMKVPDFKLTKDLIGVPVTTTVGRGI